MQIGHTSRNIRILTGCAALITASALLAGCSSGASSDPASGKAPHLEVLLPGASLDFADIWYAEATNGFAKQDVDVHIAVSGPQLSTTLAAGKGVIGCQGTTSALSAAKQGRNAVVVYSEASGISAMALVVAKDSGIKTVEDLAGKRIGTQGAGGSSFGAANLFKKYITDQGLAAPSVVPFNDSASLQASLLSGNVDATAINLAIVGSALETGRMTVLANANDPKWRKIGGDQTAAVSCWGLSNGMKKNSEAVTRFIAALRVADSAMQKSDTDAISSKIAELTEFKDFSTAQVKSLVESSKPFFTKTDGEITSAVWSQSKKSFAGWGLGLSASEPAFAYNKIIDMTYWNKAGDLIK